MKPHIFPFTIAYADTDAEGIVYHARYLEIAERARMNWLRGRVAVDGDIGFVVRELNIKYLQPLKVGDEFGWQEEPDTIKTDPFAEKDNDERICVITDIKENGAGYKWVKYYYKKYYRPGHEPVGFTEEINAFVRYRKRINTKSLEN